MLRNSVSVALDRSAFSARGMLPASMNVVNSASEISPSLSASTAAKRSSLTTLLPDDLPVELVVSSKLGALEARADEVAPAAEVSEAPAGEVGGGSVTGVPDCAAAGKARRANAGRTERQE